MAKPGWSVNRTDIVAERDLTEIRQGPNAAPRQAGQLPDPLCAMLGGNGNMIVTMPPRMPIHAAGQADGRAGIVADLAADAADHAPGGGRHHGAGFGLRIVDELVDHQVAVGTEIDRGLVREILQSAWSRTPRCAPAP